MPQVLVRRSIGLAAISALALACAGCGEGPRSAPRAKAPEPRKVYVETPVGQAPPSQAAQAQSDRMLVGDGRPFTMTGSIPCVIVAADADHGRSCAVGIIRGAPGAADVWVAMGEGRERHITFANGQAVRADGPGQLRVETAEGRFKVHVGAELYEIPVSVVSGDTPPAPGARPAPRPRRPAEGAPVAKTEAAPPAPEPAPAPAPAPSEPAKTDSPPI